METQTVKQTEVTNKFDKDIKLLVLFVETTDFKNYQMTYT